MCTKHNFDVRTACNDGPFYQRAEFDPVLSDLEDFGPRIRFRPVHAEGADSCQRNADGTINVVVESRCKLRDEEGFEFYVRDEEMPFDEDRFHEFKGLKRQVFIDIANYLVRVRLATWSKKCSQDD